MKDFREILMEEDYIDESSGAMFAIKNLMNKYKKTTSKSEKDKLAQEISDQEEKAAKNPYWKNATIKKDYDKFKKEMEFA